MGTSLSQKRDLNRRRTRQVFVFIFGAGLAWFFGLFFLGLVLMPILTKTQKVITMPNLIGLGEKEAEVLLKREGLQIGEKKWAFNLQYPEGKVVAQSPRPNLRVKRGRIVELTLSKGRGKTLVPDFSGKKVDEVLDAIELVGLEAKVETVFGEEEGEVMTLVPSPGTPLEKGSVVRVLVGQREGFVLMPRLIGMRFDEAKRVIDSLNLTLEEVREKESEEDAGVVIFQYPEEEMRVKIRGKVVLVLAK